MGATTNYDLNIPSGSDNVNILTQITPNFETIDEVMKANEDAGVQIATELYANNIHAITRTKADAAAMRFTATSNFTLGDTFTVDGVQVTALAPNGATLPDQAYTIGCEVFAILKGTRLTVWAGNKATDSEKLNGQPASYYGTDEDVQTAQQTATSALELANTVNTNLANKIARQNFTITTDGAGSFTIPFTDVTKFINIYTTTEDVYIGRYSIRTNWIAGYLVDWDGARKANTTFYVELVYYN